MLERAIRYEKAHKARTYLVVDEDASPESGIKVLGYFSLALQTLNIEENVSKTKRKFLDGFSAQRNGKDISSIPCFLIGQLARCTSVGNEDIPGSFFIEKALGYIALAQEAVSGRIVLAECKPEQKLIKFYTDNDFEEFARINDSDGRQMVQLILKVN